MSKKIASFLFLIVCLVITGIMFWILIAKKNKSESSLPLSDANTINNIPINDEINSVQDLVDGEYQFNNLDTNNWKRYFNEQLGFETRIPSNWQGESWNEGICLKEKEKQYYFESATGNECPIYISSADRYSSARLNFRDFIRARKENYNARILSLEVNGTKAINVGGLGSSTYFFSDQKAWNISLNLAPESYPEVFEIYPQILKSFKLID